MDKPYELDEVKPFEPDEPKAIYKPNPYVMPQWMMFLAMFHFASTFTAIMAIIPMFVWLLVANWSGAAMFFGLVLQGVLFNAVVIWLFRPREIDNGRSNQN